MKGEKISVVIPAYNEEETIGMVLRDLNATIEKHFNAEQIEVIVVDDHSKDATKQISEECGAKVLSNTAYPNGKGHALRYGFERCTGDIIVMMDADYSHRPEDMPALLKPFEDKAVGLVVGSRIYGGSDEYTPVRSFGNIFLTYMFGLCHGRYMSDALNGYKLFRRNVFFDHSYNSSDYEIEIELLVNALRSGYRIVEVPSHERSRAGGQAKSSVVKHGTKFLWRILREAQKNRKRPQKLGQPSVHAN